MAARLHPPSISGKGAVLVDFARLHQAAYVADVRMRAALKLSRSSVLAAALVLADPAIAGGPDLVAVETPVAASPAALQDRQGFHFGIAAALPDGQ
jgi:hypothetical protein